MIITLTKCPEAKAYSYTLLFFDFKPKSFPMKLHENILSVKHTSVQVAKDFILFYL